MKPIIPYLTFNGDAAEALKFYEKALNGTVQSVQYFKEAPIPNLPDGYENRVLHAVFQSGDLIFMVSDAAPQHNAAFGNSVSLSLDFSSEADIDDTFNKLSAGGVVTMPLEKTFWNAKFGMITDAYGMNWMLNYDYPKES